MARFVLIDHNLRNCGGHHFYHASMYVKDAQQAGYNPILVLNHEFQDRDRLPEYCQVLPLFRYSGYSPHRLSEDGQSIYPVDLDARYIFSRPSERFLPAVFQRLYNHWVHCRDLLTRRSRQKHIAHFSSVLKDVFSQFKWAPDDLVFFPTVTTFDLVGLVHFLKEVPESIHLNWHLCFHSPPFFGRESEGGSPCGQQEIIRRHFCNLLEYIPDHRLFFYSTTERLCRQYESVCDASFVPLPVPVDFSADILAEQLTSKPIRIVCAGRPRQEKGMKKLSHIIDVLWDPFFSTGRLQMLFQSKHVAKDKDELKFDKRVTSDTLKTPPVIVLEHPMVTLSYQKLVCSSGIGLFLYDRMRYHSRASGVMIEMLAAGVPVIVPAGTWMSQQVARETYKQLSDVRHNLPIVTSSLTVNEIEWQEAILEDETNRSDRLRLDAAGATCLLCVEGGVTDLLFLTGWSDVSEYDSCLRVECGFDGPEGKLAVNEQILDRPDSGQPAACLFRLPSGTTTVRLRLAPAFDGVAISLQELEICWLDTTTYSEGKTPVGSIGLVAAGADQVPSLIVEMVSNYDHYRTTAMEFTRSWREKYAPGQARKIIEERCHLEF